MYLYKRNKPKIFPQVKNLVKNPPSQVLFFLPLGEKGAGEGGGGWGWGPHTIPYPEFSGFGRGWSLESLWGKFWNHRIPVKNKTRNRTSKKKIYIFPFPQSLQGEDSLAKEPEMRTQDPSGGKMQNSQRNLAFRRRKDLKERGLRFCACPWIKIRFRLCSLWPKPV